LSAFVADDSYTGITSLGNIISLNKKVRLEIGLKNTTGVEKYKDFPIL
jgi:hypothetical protein